MSRPRLLRSVEFSPALLTSRHHWSAFHLHTQTSTSSTPKLSLLRRYRYRGHQIRDMSSTTKGASPPADPSSIERTSSPYPDPRQLGPKSQILATRTSNYHSTSLRMVTATNATVNRTCKLSSSSSAVPTISISSRRPHPFIHNG
jgi:hypothetical protein